MEHEAFIRDVAHAWVALTNPEFTADPATTDDDTLSVAADVVDALSHVLESGRWNITEHPEGVRKPDEGA